MHQLHTKGLGQGVRNVMDLPGDASPGSSITTVDWCDTRVVAVERPGHEPVNEDNMRWYSGATELQSLGMEKWFARSCRVKVERLRPEEFEAEKGAPVVIITFVNGAKVPMLHINQDLYQWH